MHAAVMRRSVLRAAQPLAAARASTRPSARPVRSLSTRGVHGRGIAWVARSDVVARDRSVHVSRVCDGSVFVGVVVGSVCVAWYLIPGLHLCVSCSWKVGVAIACLGVGLPHVSWVRFQPPSRRLCCPLLSMVDVALVCSHRENSRSLYCTHHHLPYDMTR